MLSQKLDINTHFVAIGHILFEEEQFLQKVKFSVQLTWWLFMKINVSKGFGPHMEHADLP
jgi:hypothetical protein